MAKVQNLTATELRQAIKDHLGLQLVHFASPLFSGCKYVGEQIRDLAESFDGLLEISEVKLELHQADLIREFGIELLPTLVVFRDGQEVERLEKIIPTEEFETCLRDIVSYYLPPAGLPTAERKVAEDEKQ